MTTRMQLAKAPKWQHDLPVLGTDMYFIPRVYVLYDGLPINDVRNILDVDLSVTPLYVSKGQEVVMRIVDGKLQIRVYAQTADDSQGSAENRREVNHGPL